MTESFSVRVDRGDAVTTVTLTGEIDLTTRAAIDEAVAEALAEPRAPRLVVDLRAVTFIDSSGLSAAIVVPARAAEDAGLDFKVMSGPGATRALEVSGLDRFVQHDEID
ncbi:MAG: anti-sigma factor antagonist [Acidimicrobiaceae bacterium]|jgi:anti-anti-sigma factor